MHGFGEAAEDHARLGQLLLEGGAHRHGVEHRIDRNTCQARSFVQWHAKLFVGFQQLRVHLVERGVLLFWRGEVADVLIVDGRDPQLGPIRRGHGQPVAIGFQTPLGQPFGLVFLRRNHPNHVFAEPFRRDIGGDVGDKTRRVLARQGGFNFGALGGHGLPVALCGKKG